MPFLENPGNYSQANSSVKKRNIIVKAITFALFGLLIASFAVWGIGDIFRVNPQETPVAEVGDARIEQQEFARLLGRELNRLSQRLGQRFDAEQARALGVVDQVVGQMVGRALVDQKIADMGLTISEDQLKQRIVEEPAFRNEAGQFDRARFAQALLLSNLGEQEFLDGLRRDILREQLVGPISDAAPAPKLVAEALFAYRQEMRTARVLRVPKDSVSEIPEPDEAALTAFHKEFSNSFMAPEYRAVTYIRLRPEDLLNEISIADSELLDEFELRRDEFTVPEKRQIQQIVLNDEAAANAAMERIRGGASFDTVAKDATGDAPVDLGLVEAPGLPGELADAAFALKAGETSEPVSTGLGWHILHVTSVVPGEEPDFAKARDELREDMAMAQAIDSLVSIANRLDDELASGASMEEAAAALNVKAKKIDAIDRNGNDPKGEAIPNLPPDQFLQIVYDTPPGEGSLLTETDDGGFFILHVDGVTPAQLRPLDEVRDQVVELWRDARRAEKTSEIASTIAGRVRNGEKLEDIGKADGYAVETTEPLNRFESDPARAFAPTLASKLFDLSPGEVDTTAAPAGHLVFQLVEIGKANPVSRQSEVTALQNSLSGAMHNDLLEEFMASLRSEYGVTINQTAIDDVLATF